MSRRGTAKKKTAEFDPISCSRVVNMLVNRMMKHGKKSLAYQNFLSSRTYKVPVAIPLPQGILLAIRWLLEASRKRSGTSMTSQLSSELIDAASKKRGKAIRKKEETHKRAEASRSFAHFR
ncbi:hypothetical protein LUZ62_000683 [Rhynchospora pubera]|uniref:Small ribosomal subunit protein uS7 domain-containing protein n=1 Tax=Rhynchospora pubera TaxID=906938 RepID=A0AAV8BGA8_9POAL|nr:hypothetical protein LUZ62_000683 [Rhynchospora pubera]